MMKRVLTILLVTLCSLPLFAGQAGLPQAQEDIRLIDKYFHPDSSDQVLRNVDTLTQQTVRKLSSLIGRKANNGEKSRKARKLWSQLEVALNHRPANTERPLPKNKQQAAVREQVDMRADTLNRFYQKARRNAHQLGGSITLQFYFSENGYISAIEVKEADEGMTALAKRIMPALRTLRIKPQPTPERVEYKLNFFPLGP